MAIAPLKITTHPITASGQSDHFEWNIITRRMHSLVHAMLYHYPEQILQVHIQSSRPISTAELWIKITYYDSVAVDDFRAELEHYFARHGILPIIEVDAATRTIEFELSPCNLFGTFRLVSSMVDTWALFSLPVDSDSDFEDAAAADSGFAVAASGCVDKVLKLQRGVRIISLLPPGKSEPAMEFQSLQLSVVMEVMQAIGHPVTPIVPELIDTYQPVGGSVFEFDFDGTNCTLDAMKAIRPLRYVDEQRNIRLVNMQNALLDKYAPTAVPAPAPAPAGGLEATLTQYGFVAVDATPVPPLVEPFAATRDALHVDAVLNYIHTEGCIDLYLISNKCRTTEFCNPLKTHLATADYVVNFTPDHSFGALPNTTLLKIYPCRPNIDKLEQAAENLHSALSLGMQLNVLHGGFRPYSKSTDK